MKQKTILVMLLLTTTYAYPQDISSTVKHRIYSVQLNAISLQNPYTGYLSSISDSSVYISKRAVALQGSMLKDDSKTERKFNYDDIARLTIRRKGSTARGLWMGAVIGGVVGAIGGFASGDDPPNTIIFRMTAGEKAALLGTGGAFSGALIGTIVGAVAHKTFIIGGKKEEFQKMQLKLIH